LVELRLETQVENEKKKRKIVVVRLFVLENTTVESDWQATVVPTYLGQFNISYIIFQKC